MPRVLFILAIISSIVSACSDQTYWLILNKG